MKNETVKKIQNTLYQGGLLACYSVFAAIAYENFAPKELKNDLNMKRVTEKPVTVVKDLNPGLACTPEVHKKFGEDIARSITQKDSIGFEEFKKQHVIMTKENYESLEQSLAQKGISIGVK